MLNPMAGNTRLSHENLGSLVRPMRRSFRWCFRRDRPYEQSAWREPCNAMIVRKGRTGRHVGLRVNEPMHTISNRLALPRWSRPAKWMPVVRGIMVGLVSAFAILAARWIRKSAHPRPRLEPSPTLDLDLRDLLPANSAPPPRPPRPSGPPSLMPPNVHSFEVH
jgi:hypothetical protein